MADPRFFPPPRGPFSLGELSATSGAAVGRGADASRRFTDVAALDDAGAGHVSFLLDGRYADALSHTRAGACVLAPGFVDKAPPGLALLVSDDPHTAYARIARAFHPAPGVSEGRHPTAVVDPTATVGAGTRIDSGAVIEAGAEIGRGCEIAANAVIGAGVVVGDDSRIGACASLSHALVGARVLIHAGARIGTRGFGFAMGAAGHLEIPQLGRVVIGDDVEIGANATVDRGSGGDTVVGAGTKIDNLVQIGHNVRIGRGCVIVAQAGIAGSTILDDFAVIAAQGGVAGHLRIGKGARVGAKSGVMRDVPDGETVLGVPALPIRQFFKQMTLVARLAKQKDR